MVKPDLNTLWAAHRRIPFPPAARGAEVKGIDLVLLDSLAAGCISSLVDRAGERGPDELAQLAELAQQIRTIFTHLDGETRQYFARLSGVVEAALLTGDHRK